MCDPANRPSMPALPTGSSAERPERKHGLFSFAKSRFACMFFHQAAGKMPANPIKRQYIESGKEGKPMNTLESAISMPRVMPEADARGIFEMAKKRFEDKNTPFAATRNFGAGASAFFDLPGAGICGFAGSRATPPSSWQRTMNCGIMGTFSKAGCNAAFCFSRMAKT